MRKLFPAISITLMAWAAFAVATAQAAVVTVGSPLTQTFTTQPINVLGTLANSVLPEAGAQVTSPITGTVVRWHLLDSAGGPFKLRVLRPGAGSAFTGVATSAGQIPTSLGLQTFTTSLPIQAGDLIGLDNAQSIGDSIGLFSAPSVEFSAWIPPLADGSSGARTAAQMAELAFNAEVQPLPKIAVLGATTGPTAGGTSVLIAGSDFEGTTTVKFGGLTATFSQTSETTIVASAPPNPIAGAVPVTVTTVAGTATAAQQFNYTAPPTTPPPPLAPAPTCKVPKLKGKSLKSAKKRIRAADCRVGTLTKKEGATAKDGEVVKQVPKPGATVPVNTKVKVTLAP